MIHWKVFVLLLAWATSVTPLKLPIGLKQDDNPFERKCRLSYDGQEYFYPQYYYQTSKAYKPCKDWKFSSFSMIDRIEKDLRENFCRNPGDHTEPYCYALDTSESNPYGKKACQVPFCPQLKDYRTSQKGWEYQGHQDLKEERSCLNLCQVYQDLGPACKVNVSNGDIVSYTTWIPCDVPLIGEIPLVKTVFRMNDTSIPLTTWYVPPSSEMIKLTGPGEMLLLMPDSELKTPPFTMKFRIRLANPDDAQSFHLNINFLPEDSFAYYYNVSFAREGLEIQRNIYDVLTNESKIMPKRESSGKYKKIPFLAMRYEWVEFVIEFDTKLISLYFKGQGKPVIQLKSPLYEYEDLDWLYDDLPLLKRYKIPKYINFHSVRGMIMVVIDEVNGQIYECFEGQVKLPINAAAHLLPMGVMPIKYGEGEDPTDSLQNQNKPREITLKLSNTPASVLFTSAPLYEGIKTSQKKFISALHIAVTRQEIVVKSCGIISKVTNSLDITCKHGSSSVNSSSKLLNLGYPVFVTVLNSLNGNQSNAVVTFSFGFAKSKPYRIKYPLYLRFWTVAKEASHTEASVSDSWYLSLEKATKKYSPTEEYSHTEDTVSQRGPLNFALVSQRCKKSRASSMLSNCISGENEKYQGEISWSETGKSCIPWSLFDNWIVRSLFNERLPQHNFCRYYPQDAFLKTEEDFISGEEEEEEEVPASFWCFVTLEGDREKCDIPDCSDLERKMGCGFRQEDKRNLCDKTDYSIFYLTLNLPSDPSEGLFNEVYHIQQGFEFRVKRMYHSQDDPLCVGVYGDPFPLIRFMITNASLSLGLYNESSYEFDSFDMKALTQRNSYYLNTWSFNTYTITQSEEGWHLFHGGNVLPAITYNTTVRIHYVKFSSCNVTQVTHLQRHSVVMSIKPLIHASHIQELLYSEEIKQADTKSEWWCMGYMDRFYEIGRKYDNEPEKTIVLFILGINSTSLLNIELVNDFQELKNCNIPLTIVLGYGEISIFLSGNKDRTHQFDPKLFEFTRFNKLKIILRFVSYITSVKVLFGSESLECGVESKLSYYGIHVQKGNLRIKIE